MMEQVDGSLVAVNGEEGQPPAPLLQKEPSFIAMKHRGEEGSRQLKHEVAQRIIETGSGLGGGVNKANSAKTRVNSTQSKKANLVTAVSNDNFCVQRFDAIFIFLR